MSVLIVTPDIVGPIKNGGIGTACFHYARSLANARIEISILFTGPIESSDITFWTDWYARQGIKLLTLHDLPKEEWKITYGSRWHSERSYAILRFLCSNYFKYVLFQDWHANGFWTTRYKRLKLGLSDSTIGVIAHSPTEWQKEGMETFG